MSWTYYLHQRVSRVLARRLWLASFLLACALSFGVAFSTLFSRAAHLPWAWTYSALLIGSGWFPIPFILCIAWITLHLGTDISIPLGISSLWFTSIISYVVTRTFPEAAERLTSAWPPSYSLKSLDKLLGQRHFEPFLAALLDPRIELRFKTAYQGSHCIPVAWFALMTGILWPALLTLSLHALEWMSPAGMKGWAEQHPAFGLAIVFAWISSDLHTKP